MFVPRAGRPSFTLSREAQLCRPVYCRSRRRGGGGVCGSDLYPARPFLADPCSSTRAGPNRSQGMATPPAATTPPCTPNARTDFPPARSGRSLGLGWLQPPPHQSFEGFGFSRPWNCRCSWWAGAKGFRLGTDGGTPSVSACAPAPIGAGGRGFLALSSEPLPQSQRDDGEYLRSRCRGRRPAPRRFSVKGGKGTRVCLIEEAWAD